jgi:hypothetical protein
MAVLLPLQALPVQHFRSCRGRGVRMTLDAADENKRLKVISSSTRSHILSQVYGFGLKNCVTFATRHRKPPTTTFAPFSCEAFAAPVRWTLSALARSAPVAKRQIIAKMRFKCLQSVKSLRKCGSNVMCSGLYVGCASLNADVSAHSGNDALVTSV